MAQSCTANHCTAPLEQLGVKCTLAVIVVQGESLTQLLSLVRFSPPSAAEERQLWLKILQCGGGTAHRDPLIHFICRTITNNRCVNACVRVTATEREGDSALSVCLSMSALKMGNVKGKCLAEFTDNTHMHAVSKNGGEKQRGVLY